MKKIVKAILGIAAILFLVVVAAPAFMSRTPLQSYVPKKNVEKHPTMPFPKELVDEEVYNSMKASYDLAETYASEKLDEWVENIMEKAGAKICSCDLRKK